MNEQLQEYYDSLIEHIKASSDVEGHIIEFEFLNYVMQLLSDASEFDDDYAIVEDGRDGAGRWLIDGYCLDSNNSTLLLFGAILSSSDEVAVISRREIESIIRKLSNFLKKVLTEKLTVTFEPSSNCYQAANLIFEKWCDITNIRFMVLSNRPSSERMREITIDDIDNKVCTVNLWDLKRIYELEASSKEREDIIIDLKNESLPCLIAYDEVEGERSILTVISGAQLASLYGKWGARLLEQNVRSFLQYKGKVNKGIKATIENEPKRFFAYNNGLTTIAEAATIENTNQGMVITELRNLQIVNGGQTTAAIYSSFTKDKKDVSNVFVQMKLTVIAADKISEFVPKISRYANSQNKVSDADLFSNHPFHVRLEELAGRLIMPAKLGKTHGTFWFYERARGQYLNAQLYLSQSERKKFQLLKPRHQLLTKTDVAKIINSWNCLPHEVSKGAQKNFAKFAELVNTQWEKDNLIFNELYFRSLVCKASIFRELESRISNEEWYRESKGYRANLVTYAIAAFAYELKRSSLSLNIDLLWRAPSIPEQILKILCKLSQQIQQLLLADNRSVVNPSEYAKREFLWEMVKKSISFNIQEIEAFLISNSENNELTQSSKKTQKIDDGIRLQERVIQIPKATWMQLQQFLIDNDEATPTLLGILETVMSSNIRKIPSEKQSEILIKLLDRYADKLSKYN